MPYIRLSNPAICIDCGGYMKKGRGAFWDAGTVTCVKCAKKRGMAEIDEDEEAILDRLEEQINGKVERIK